VVIEAFSWPRVK
jgi:hypothetical protein